MAEEERHFVGPYELLDVIGKGAQASIYRARYRGEGKPGIVDGQIVALKRMVVDDQYFDRQGNFGIELQHKNIVQYLDHFREDSFEERPCIIMEYLEGYTLEDAIKESSASGGLEWDMAKHIFFQCMEGFVFAYSQGVVHRDVKPSNIFITEEGEVKLIDFGVARRIDGESTVGGFRGTLDYMSPDFVTVSGFTGDEQSDVFSLGICFFESLVGLLPYDKLGANAEFEFMSRWASSPEANFSITGWIKHNKHGGRVNARKLDHTRTVLDGLSQFIKRCLTADRSKRFTSFAQMQRALGRIDYKRLKSDMNTYQFTDVLGIGGFGRVYKARQSNDYSKEFAVKELLSSKNGKRFKREAELMQKYPHPNIVSCIELIEEDVGGDTRMYLVMEYLPGMPGSSLRDRIRQSLKASGGKHGMNIMEALQVFAKYLEGLEVLHQNGVLHRDLKPANLYAPHNLPDMAKLLDLGIARDAGSTMTKAGAPGTLDYMAPEFATETDFKGSAGSDVYALGLALYEAITGSPAFTRLSRSTEPPEVAFYKRATSMPRSDLDHPALQSNPGLIRILQRAMEPHPTKRYRSAADMHRDIRAVLGLDAAATQAAPAAMEDFTMPTPVAPQAYQDATEVAPAPAPPPGGSAAAPKAPKGAEPPPPPPRRSRKSASQKNAQPKQAPAPRENAFSRQVAKKKNPVGAILGVLFTLLLLGGLGGGAYYVFFLMPDGAQVDCVDAQNQVEQGLAPIEALLRLDEPMLESLVRLRSTLHEGVQSCPDVAWSPYLQRLKKPMTAFPEELRTALIQAVVDADVAQAQSHLALLKKVGVAHGTPIDFGLSTDDLRDMVTQSEASIAYGELVHSLRARELGAPQLQGLADVKAANEAYEALQTFRNRDWSGVDPAVRALGEPLIAEVTPFLSGLSTAFAGFLTRLDGDGTKANRAGTGVQALYKQVQDPALTASSVVLAFPALQKQHETLTATLRIYLNPQTLAEARKLTTQLQDPAVAVSALLKGLQAVAELETSTLPDAEKSALDAAANEAVQRVGVILERQKDTVVAKYAGNDCEGGEVEYQKMQTFKDALPKVYFEQALSRVEKQLSNARARCQTYINELTSFQTRIKPFADSKFWDLGRLDQAISSVGEMAAAYADATTKELDVSRDARRMGQGLNELLGELGRQQGPTRQATLMKGETLLAGLKVRQKDLTPVISPAELGKHEAALQKQLATCVLKVNNPSAVPAKITLKGQAEQLLAAQASILLQVPVSGTGEQSFQVLAMGPGAVPQTKTFSPVRGGYLEMDVAPKLIEAAAIKLVMKAQADGSQLSARLIRPGKGPEPWPEDLRLPPGTYDVLFSRDDYQDVRSSFMVKPGASSLTVNGPVTTSWQSSPELKRLLSLIGTERDDPGGFARLPATAFIINLKTSSYRERLDTLRKKWDQSRTNAWEGPIARSEIEINQVRERLFQVSDFGGVQVTGSLRRFEDAAEQPVVTTLTVPAFSKTAPLPPVMRLRVDRIGLWAAALKNGDLSTRARETLSKKLTTLYKQLGSDAPEFGEEMLLDQWVLAGNFRRSPEGNFSEDLRMQANRLIAHNDYLYPTNYSSKLVVATQYMTGSDAFNHYDALLAIYAAYNQFHHSCMGLPPAVQSQIKKDRSRYTKLTTVNKKYATLLRSCMDRLSVAQVALVVEHVSHDAENRVAIFTLLDRICPRGHPLRSSVTPWLQNQTQDVVAIRKSLTDWQINATSGKTP